MDFRTLNLLYRSSKEYSHEIIRRHDISDTECMICTFIFSSPDCTQDEVSAALKTDKTTVAKALLDLEEKKIVERSPDAVDKRKKRLSITENAEEKISEIKNIHDNWLSQIMSSLSEDEQKEFESYFIRLLDASEKLSRDQNE